MPEKISNAGVSGVWVKNSVSINVNNVCNAFNIEIMYLI
jgi:hypothetical protein